MADEQWNDPFSRPTVPDFGTRPKSGAPESVNLGLEIMGQMLSPIPVYFWVPLLANWDPIDYPVADLCAAPPPPPESWTVSDLFRALDPAQYSFETAKLIRMAKAGLWTTYCEFYPLDPLSTDPLLVHADAYVAEVWGPSFFPQQFTQTVTDVDFWAFYVRCLEPATSGGPPHLSGGGGGASDPWVGSWPNVADEQRVSIINVGSYWPNKSGSGPDVPFLPTGMWRIDVPSPDGRWSYGISAWNLNGRVTPPPVEVWPPAPPSVTPYQFTDATAAQIVTMAGEWTAHRIAGAIVPGMLTEVSADVDELQIACAAVGLNVASILAELTARGLDADALAAEVEKILVKLYEDRPEEFTLAGPPTEFTGFVHLDELPDDCRGVLVQVDVPIEWGTVGEHIPIAWDLGYVAWGQDDGLFPSERIKHPAQFFVMERTVGNFPYGATGLRVELREPLAGRYSWLLRNPPPERPL